MALNLYWKTPFHKIKYSNPDVIALGKIIGRSSDAVAMKLANYARLDESLQARQVGGLKNGSKGEELLWNEFANRLDELGYESELALSKLLHQPIEMVSEIDVSDLAASGEERNRVVKVRVKQAFFRKAVLASYDLRCCITGLNMPQLLNASHIVPWSHNEATRLLPNNGLCLNALHDRAFDRGLISVTPEYKICLSNAIKARKKESLIETYFLPFEGKQIRMPDRQLPNPEYLKYHNEFVFLKDVAFLG